MDGTIAAELQATCSTLGYFENRSYYKDPLCLGKNLLQLIQCILMIFKYFVLFSESVKDLIRFLKRETETGNVRQILGEFQTLKTDLIPLIREFYSDKILFDTVIRSV